VDDRLLERAKRLKLNLSQVFEAGLGRGDPQARGRGMAAAQPRALEAYNEHIEKHGAFSDGMRSF